PNSGKILVENFSDPVLAMEEWEQDTWDLLPDGEEEVLGQTGVPQVFGENGYDSYARRWIRPTIEVNGIGGGYQGEGSKTVIPKEALVKLSCRLVPNQDPLTVIDQVSSHLREHCPDGVKLDIIPGHHGKPYVMDPQAGYGKAAQAALTSVFSEEPRLIREGGSIPIIESFQRQLGVDTLMLGLALPDCMAHAPNENFPVANFLAGIELNQALLEEIAAV
ncbi:MAG: M20/M25/M40 family metallo-hydrolase, partial [Verrucomicrobiota bacterium]